MKDRHKTVVNYVGKSLLIALIYLIAIQLGVYFSQSLNFVSSIWIPLGLSIAFIYYWGYRFLPVVFIICLSAALLSGLPLPVSLPPVIALTLGCYLAVMILKQRWKINPGLTSLRDVMAILIVGVIASLLPASVGSVSYLSGGLITSDHMLTFWLAWWSVDLLGIMLIVPLVLVWNSSIKSNSRYLQKRWEWLILLVVVFVTWWIFRQELAVPFKFGSLTYLIFPFLFWIALRLHQPGVTLANLFICLMALFTAFNTPTAGIKPPIDSLIMLEVFVLALVFTSLTVAALFTERDEANLNLTEFNLNLEERINQRTRDLKSLNNQLKQELLSKHAAETELRVSQENLRTIIDNISDAMVLLNTEGKVVDLNENVLSLFRVSREKALNDFDLKDFSSPKKSQRELATYFLRAINGENVSFDWEARRPTDNTTFDVEVSMKRIRLNNQPLVVVSVRDLSERKLVEAAEHEQRMLAEALQNTAAALSSTLELDKVFDRILKNVGKVVPHDAVNLMLIENGIARIVHSHGYQKLGMLNYIRNIRFEVSKTYTLRTMIETGNPSIIPDINKSPEWVLPHGIKWIQSYAGAPIRIRGMTIGFLQLDSGTPGFFKKEHSSRLQAFADQAAVAIENARLYGEVQQLAITDPLTGLLNRHGFNPPAKREFEIARRYNRKVSIIFFDIDHLKNINDKFGHPAGDKALQMIADCCRSTLREIDLIGRFGGDEFISMMPETGLEDAIAIAKRLKNCINSSVIEHGDGKVPVTISVGVAGLTQDIKSLEELIDFADRGSYLSKSQGRDSIATVQSLPKTLHAKKSRLK
jgi:diguanylate cyclase (GGDEF)-like protein/PAS domain S-box-containing protein